MKKAFRMTESLTSPRQYLKALIVNEKASAHGRNSERLARSLGMSTSSVKMILSGKRRLQIDQAHRIAEALRLSASEQAQLEALTLLEQAKTAQAQRYYRRRLRDLKKDMSTRFAVSAKSFLDSWKIPALLIYLIDIAKVSEQGLAAVDFEQVRASFGFDRAFVERTLAAWEKQGLLEIRKDQKIHFAFDRLGGLIARKAFVKATIQEGLRRIESDWDKPDTRFEASTLSLDADEIPNFLAEYKALVDKYVALDSKPNAEKTIVQVCLQMFRVL
jgi:uncharacterized protein (TIGR02147 family)